jgi:transposase-like protein
VFASKEKLVLAWHISKTRTEKDAIQLFKKAWKTTQHTPEILTTDGLAQYPLALQKVLGRKNTHHIGVEEFGPNNYIERLFREIKRRIKWFSTFRAQHSHKHSSIYSFTVTTITNPTKH